MHTRKKRRRQMKERPLARLQALAMRNVYASRYTCLFKIYTSVDGRQRKGISSGQPLQCAASLVCHRIPNITCARFEVRNKRGSCCCDMDPGRQKRTNERSTTPPGSLALSYNSHHGISKSSGSGHSSAIDVYIPDKHLRGTNSI